MKRDRRPMQRAAVITLMLTFAGFVAPLTAGSALSAQERGPVQRVVQGKVQDRSGAALKGAVVYLKDSRSSAVKSAISGDDGSYRFGQLSGTTDYELWATSDGKKSPSRTVSSFDSKNEFNLNLKIDK